MNPQTLHFVIAACLFIAVGSAMPNREKYSFPREIGLYLFDWFYATVKIITFNIAREAEKKGINIGIPADNTTKIETQATPNSPEKE